MSKSVQEEKQRMFDRFREIAFKLEQGDFNMLELGMEIEKIRSEEGLDTEIEKGIDTSSDDESKEVLYRRVTDEKDE